ncbi:oxygen-insensitive NADPH nitroreductase [Brevibacillus sp. AY1]|uniref:oxygen-insensitive NADPH nitroreductase n=1 Tax=Brevibacillus sp. AY1 TaxID=2807621 RepID=UPI0024540E00|nr:oxygen-insensitive NADPH nitroreductase [Brevibacillus sp. AY1]MDH4617908.1 oxygen-insensitive NADPH nitroreductase [Brevibacillus sp. AY1]
MSTEVTRLIQSHRSIRKFTDETISPEILSDVLTSGQWAPSSHNVQAYSVIVVRSDESKKQLSIMTGNQKWVEECPVFLVFCADFYKLKQACEMNGETLAADGVENFLVGAVDTALVAQNVLLAARSYGLGGVMIGGIRNNPREVAELLDLPPLTIPIMGMCLGYPAQEVEQKPRLPQQAYIHEERYQKEGIKAALEDYESLSAAYYERRSNGKQTDGWTKQMAHYVNKPRRVHMKEFVKEQGIQLN